MIITNISQKLLGPQYIHSYFARHFNYSCGKNGNNCKCQAYSIYIAILLGIVITLVVKIEKKVLYYIYSYFARHCKYSCGKNENKHYTYFMSEYI